MATINKYRVWCEVDNKWVYGWGQEEPTVCYENHQHSIQPNNITILESISEQHPTSDLDNYKLAVHASAKPSISNTTYVVWTSCGDDMVNNAIADGEMLQFSMTPGVSQKAIRVQFLPQHGRVWIHQGYLRFSNGGDGDHLHATVVALATPLQTAANLNLEIVNGWIVPSMNGTHGFADPSKISLIPRTFSKDGYWDWDGVNLIPNMTGTGSYHISNEDKVIHKYVNKVAVRGTCDTLSPLTSHDTSEIPVNYCLEVTAHNLSNTTWNADIILEIYRERTCEP